MRPAKTRIPVLLVLAVVLAVAAPVTKVPNTEAEADGYLGSVHTVKARFTNYGADGKATGAVRDVEQTYDTQGRRLEVYTGAGACTVTYDWDGEHLGRMRAVCGNPENDIETVYHWGADGKVHETTTSDRKGLLRRDVELEDSETRKESVVYGRDGQVERHIVQTWNAGAWTIESYDGDKLDKTVVQKSDPESGKEREMRMYDASGKPLQIMQVRPDGSIVEAGDPMERGRDWSARDAEGRTKEFFFDDGTNFEWHTNTFDDKGRVSGQTNYDRGHKVILRRMNEYTDDEHGNWVRKVDRECDASACRVVRVWTREITYY